MSDSPTRPRVAVGVVVWHGDCVLLHERKGPHQSGRWSSPGGHLEMFESFEDCARRELLEECGPGLEVAYLRYWHTVNTVFPDEGLHYVLVFYQADWAGGEARVMEPEKCARWAWFPWSRLPTPLMQGNELMKKAFPHADLRRHR